MIDLSGRVALVTGASRGIGRAIAAKLAGQGATVIAAARGENAAAAVQDIAAAGGRAEAATVDVGDPAAIEALVTGALARHGRIDILVNNAGITRDQLMLRMKREDWDAVIATNLTAAFLLTQAVLKPMIRQRSGRIVCISSVVGQAGNAGQANYAASKAGLIGFVKATAQEVASRSITVNVVAPGLVDTEIAAGLFATESVHEDYLKCMPISRTGTVEDIAAAVRFLCGPEASWITGVNLSVDGGHHLRRGPDVEVFSRALFGDPFGKAQS